MVDIEKGGGSGVYSVSGNRPESEYKTDVRPSVDPAKPSREDSDSKFFFYLLCACAVFLVWLVVSLHWMKDSLSNSSSAAPQSSSGYQTPSNDDGDDCLKGTKFCNVKGLNFHKGF